MSDAFDQWVEWRSKPLGDSRSIPAELYAAVTSLPEADRSDRLERLQEALARDAGESVADRLADPVLPVESGSMGVVEEFEDKGRPAHDDDDPGACWKSLCLRVARWLLPHCGTDKLPPGFFGGVRSNSGS
ncbi:MULTISPECIES: hypothetical protein [unclassified Bradyrhizobium]|uniref:hypothetical protein n=1 Tax=unclassified Bradyrhizobium TaxID=2631580 RepID=UPI001FFC2475|nr:MULTISPECIES: hypothetical protein [unclassified Bradyrhizobium]MCK1319630.1 hypothetical protein [Bradyrhizobium sp. 156]MCK1566635.1 hypothetical protein [Bradyrhizobium sp. 173]UPJ27831.1 hypothetical protein IVB54_01690 [Bradyrhizobium sp. CW1]UPJ96299.1 hypothetical protein IVB07_01610 [Bradyrhizobium sp. 172]